MLDEMGIPYDVIDVTEKPEYLEKYPIYTAPGIVIDGKLEFTGIPNRKKLVEKLREKLGPSGDLPTSKSGVA
jgi:glutaredoxin